MDSHQANSKIKIHVVDDGRIEREYMSDILREAGYDVSVSENGKMALDHLIKDQPSLLISDYHMPLMDGYQLLLEVRNSKELKSLIVIVLTADENEDAKIKLLDAGANDFLRKGVSKREILVRIRAHLAAADALKQRALLELAGACAHELNNPLAVLLSSTELLNEKTQQLPSTFEKKPMMRLVSNMLEAVGKAAKIVEQLKDIRGYQTTSYYNKIRITDLHASLNSEKSEEKK